VLAQMELTSRDLAEVLNVHYSLVSKWLNNKRPLKYNSLHLKNLVDALISIDSPHKGVTLKTIMREAYPEADLTASEKIAVYLSSYLASDNPQNRDRNLLDNIDPGRVLAKAKMDIYRKNSGRRDALMRLLDTAILLSPGQELLLFSEETPSWHMEDDDFRKLWLEKHKDILRLNNHVTMVHTVDRQAPHLLHTITQWLPLHLTGKTTALYHQEYSNSIFKPTLSILCNRAVLSGMTAEGFSDSLYTYYSSDPHLVGQFELFFAGLLANCRPMFEKTGEESATQNILSDAQRNDDSYAFSFLPLKMVIDIETFCEFLRENGVTGGKYDRCVSFFLKYRESFLNSLAVCETRQIMDISTIEQNMKEGISISEFNWIVGGNLTVTPKYFRRGLQGLIKLLEGNKNFSLALITEFALPHVKNVTLSVKENVTAIANSRVQGTQYPLIMKEPTVVRTFYQYFERYWSSIPRIQRERTNVIRRLEQLVKE
jgi:hypothetical protein